MGRKLDPAVVERSRAIVAEYQANPTITCQEVLRRFNVGQATLNQIRRKSGLSNAANPKTRGNKRELRRAITSWLACLGRRLERFISEHHQLCALTKTEVARTIGLRSGQYLAGIFVGSIDLTTSELEKIAQFMGFASAANLMMDVKKMEKQALYG